VVSAAVVSLDAQAARRGYQFLKAFPDRFTFEYPSRDWDLVAGGTSSLLTISHKDQQAAVVVEYQPLRLELSPNEIDDHFASLEVEPVTTRQAGVSGVAIKLIDIGATRVVVVDFNRRGPAGLEHARQYSMPIGRHLYRLVCSAPSQYFARHEPVFTTIVETFRVTAAAPAKPPSPAR
jgi:hypothetical protein